MAEFESPDKAPPGLERLLQACSSKRSVLFNEAIRRDRFAKRLNVSAGVVALLSGLSATAVFAEFTGLTIVKVLSATLAFISGIISLCASTYVDGRDVATMHKGAAAFLDLRERLLLEMARFEGAKDASGQALLTLKKFGRDYAAASERYDRFLSKRYSPQVWPDQH
jgi:hypothetical protein